MGDGADCRHLSRKGWIGQKGADQDTDYGVRSPNPQAMQRDFCKYRRVACFETGLHLTKMQVYLQYIGGRSLIPLSDLCSFLVYSYVCLFFQLTIKLLCATWKCAD